MGEAEITVEVVVRLGVVLTGALGRVRAGGARGSVVLMRILATGRVVGRHLSSPHICVVLMGRVRTGGDALIWRAVRVPMVLFLRGGGGEFL